MPVAADAGHRVLVKVSFTDDAGFVEAGPDPDKKGIASTPVAIRAAMPPAACPAPVLAERSRIWAGTVRVEAASQSISALALRPSHGYGSLTNFGRPLGHGLRSGRQQPTSIIAVRCRMAAPPRTPMGYSTLQGWKADLTAAARAGLRLHLCGETYDFADAVHDMQRHAYAWPTAGLDWSEAESRALVLSTASPGVPDVPRDLVAAGREQRVRSRLHGPSPRRTGVRRSRATGSNGRRTATPPGATWSADTASTETAYRDMGLSPETTRQLPGLGDQRPTARAARRRLRRGAQPPASRARPAQPGRDSRPRSRAARPKSGAPGSRSHGPNRAGGPATAFRWMRDRLSWRPSWTRRNAGSFRPLSESWR